MNNSLGLYLHIPFCRSKCDYCDFYSLAGQDDLMPRYQKALLRQIEECGTLAKQNVVDSIFIGGGTPSWYGADRVCELLSALRKNYRISREAEITMEANPDSVDAKSLDTLR